MTQEDVNAYMNLSSCFSKSPQLYGITRTNAFNAGIKEEISRRESLDMALLESSRQGCMVLFFFQVIANNFKMALCQLHGVLRHPNLLSLGRRTARHTSTVKQTSSYSTAIAKRTSQSRNDEGNWRCMLLR